MKIKDRIKSLRRVPAGKLLPNPKNWRTHPEQQRDAMRGVLAEVGFADAVPMPFMSALLKGRAIESRQRARYSGDMNDVTRILSQIEDGDSNAAEQLLPVIYDELRKLAAARLAKEKPGQTLQATALVHDAYLRLVDVERAQHWDSRGHFFSAAAEAIRRILVENSRRKARIKHGGKRGRVDLDQACPVTREPSDELLLLNEALERFEKVAPEKAKLVKLRFFAGMTIPEAAESLNISRATAERYWSYARVWLYAELNETEEDLVE